jgi:outer membrane protein assembly factor BamB
MPEWIFPTAGNVNATPAVVGHRIYAGDTSGTFYALEDDGQLVWSTKVHGPITDSALVTNRAVIFGDLKGFVYGLYIGQSLTFWLTIWSLSSPTGIAS